MFISNKYCKWYYELMAKRRLITAEGYTELHHEIPRSLGGSNHESNLVRLTAREHFIAHVLLSKMTKGVDRSRMGFALMRMITACNGVWSMKKYTPKSSIIFANAKELAVTAMKDEHPSRGKKRGPMPDSVKAKLSASRQKLLESGEIQKKISAALTGRPSKTKGTTISNERKALISSQHKGKVISVEQRARLSLALKGKKQNHRELSAEQKKARSAAMSAAKAGVPQGPHSEETKRKIGDAHRGKAISDEQRRKLSEASKAAWARKKSNLELV